VLQALRYESFEMPPDGQLPESVAADFEKWIQMGAPDPREGDGKSLIQSKIDFDKAKSYWAFQPIERPAVPMVQNDAWPRGEIDRFLLARMEAKGVAPAADADPAVVIRRLSFDLTGLPPTSEQIKEYTDDPTPENYRRIVDRLLESPQFGERWGRHWLDVVRYAESTGMERNYTYPQAWRYRDYVIAAFNADKPLDEFIAEQIAGDLLPAKSAEERRENLVATGMLAIGPKSLNERNREQFAMDVVDEQIDVTTRAFMGLTVACARCHDHKFDPFPQTEYYGLAGIFRSTDTYYGTAAAQGNRQGGQLLALSGQDVEPVRPAAPQSGPQARKQIHQQIKKLEMQAERFDKQAKGGEPDAQTKKRRQRIDAQLARLRQLLAKVRNPKGEPEEQPATGDALLLMGVLDAEDPANTEVRLRGEPNDRGQVVPRGFLTVASLTEPPAIDPDGSGRRELAAWIAGAENPLTARVAVNRTWSHLFGRGIVPTVDNFGANGEAPTHPELLDFLASEFLASGWSTKDTIRRIVTSRAYQLTSRDEPAALAADPQNTLYWRQGQRRLEAEAIRDAMLAASGRLDLAPGEGSVVTTIGNGEVGRGIDPDRRGSGSPKRSVYLPIVRGAVPESLQVFDFPEPSILTGQRDVTTVPTQALYMLNSEFVLEQSRAFAERLLGEESGAKVGRRGRTVNLSLSSVAQVDRAAEHSATQQRIQEAFQTALGREPSAEEIAAAEAFLNEAAQAAAQSDSADDAMRPDLKAWTGLCHVLFASAEFRYLQ
jgi:hypothetical protein